jgi:hypothetical protein
MRTTSRRKARTATSAPKEETVSRAAEPAPTPEPTPQADSTSAKRTAITFTDDGKIDTDAMRSATRERLRVALQDETLFDRLGLKSPAAAGDTTQRVDIPPQLFLAASKMITDSISKLATVAAIKRGYPPEEAIKLLMTPVDHDTIDPLLVKALEDWLPKIEGKYVSLYMLGAGVVSVYAPKMMAMKKPGEVVQFPHAAPAPTTEQPS